MEVSDSEGEKEDPKVIEEREIQQRVDSMVAKLLDRRSVSLEKISTLQKFEFIVNEVIEKLSPPHMVSHRGRFDYEEPPSATSPVKDDKPKLLKHPKNKRSKSRQSPGESGEDSEEERNIESQTSFNSLYKLYVNEGEESKPGTTASVTENNTL